MTLRLLLVFIVACTAAPLVAAPPNILFILADDLSWSDPACYGHTQHETPHLDRLAREGMRFTQAYAPAPICSASRAAILTGKTPARLHFEFVTKEKLGSQKLGQSLQSPPYPTDLASDEITVAELLTPTGYHTAFFGKWHLNMHHGGYLGWSPTHGPLQQGFAEGNADFGGHPYAYMKGGDRSDLALKEGEYPADSLTDKVITFLKRKQERPFFLQWSHYYVHDPIHTRCRWLFDKYRRKLPPGIPDERVTYAAMVETLDHEVGRVLAALDEAGLAQDTLVVFMSDNGGHPEYTANGPLRGSKWNLYEGGIRVPFMARWPDRIAPGTISAEPITGCDLWPTFAGLAEAKLPADTTPDGMTLQPFFAQSGAALPPRPLVWHFPFHHPEKGFDKAPAAIGIDDFVTSQTRPHSALRLGDYKLLHFYEDQRDELYRLPDDLGEQHDLSTSEPERTAQMRRQLLTHLQQSNARFAQPNTRP